MKKVVSFNELTLGILLIGIMFMIPAYFISPWYMLIINLAMALIEASLFVNSKLKSRDLPARCIRNFGFIEAHIGNVCNDSSDLYSIYRDLVTKAIEERSDILIDTWLIQKRKINKVFENTAQYIDPPILQKLSNLVNKLKYGRKDKRKCYRCVIQIRNLTDLQKTTILNNLNKKINLRKM